MRNLLFCIYFIASFTFASDKYGREWEDTCDQNQSTMNECAEREYIKLDNELNKLYKMKMSSLTNNDSKSYLKSSQLAWISFRDKDCLYQLSQNKMGGSISSLIKFTCMYVHTKRRIDDLNEYLACTDDGCPF